MDDRLHGWAAERMRRASRQIEEFLQAERNDAMDDDEPDYWTKLRDQFAVAMLTATYGDYLKSGGDFQKVFERAWGLADHMMAARDADPA